MNLTRVHFFSVGLAVTMVINMVIEFYLQYEMWENVPDSPGYINAYHVSIYFWGIALCLILLVLATSLVASTVFLTKMLHNSKSGY